MTKEEKKGKKDIKSDFRKAIRDRFISALEESIKKDESSWKAPWIEVACPTSIYKKYRGVNRIALMLVMLEKNSVDPRFFTFNQIADREGKFHKGKKWHLKKGSKATWVEYWSVWDYTDRKALNDPEEIKKAEEDGHKVYWKTFYNKVFHASDIEGMDPWVQEKHPENCPDDLIAKIAKGMEVPILHDQINRAYYVPSDDQVHLPKPEFFKTSEGYNATALHELAHSTGNKKRLDRPIENVFGNDEYAFEELVAEMASCFASEYLSVSLTETEFNNSKKYVKSWISGLKEKPEALEKAISAAEKDADYMYEAPKAK